MALRLLHPLLSEQTRGPGMFPNTNLVTRQCTNLQFQRPTPLNRPTLRSNPYLVNPTPVPPSPVTRNTSSTPDSPASNLMDHMREVQLLMLEINRLEREPGERNSQHMRDLHQHVTELSNTNGLEPVHQPANITPDFEQPPPVYMPRSNISSERPEQDGRG